VPVPGEQNKTCGRDEQVHTYHRLNRIDMGNGTQVMTQVTTQVIRIGIEGRYAARNNTCAGDEPAPVSAWNGSVFELFLPIIICASKLLPGIRNGTGSS